MRYALAFSALGGLLVWQAFHAPWWIAWLTGWAGLSCLLVGIAYGGVGPRLFGKRPDGRLAWWSLVLLGPYLASYRLLWHVVRIIGREPASHQVSPGIYLGRRPMPCELPVGVTHIVDLCVEFPALSSLAPQSPRYSPLPTLDAGLSDVAAFRRLVADVAADDGPVYVHCASGHGRGAMFTAALLMERHLAHSVEEAEALLRAARPGVRMSPGQRQFVRRAMTTASIDHDRQRHCGCS